jgi:ribosome-associated protein
MAKKKEGPVKTTPVKTAKAPAKKKATKKAPAKKTTTAKKQAVKTVKAKPAKAKSSKTENDPNRILADACVEGILEVKGRNISVLDLRELHNRVSDYFIICQADSNTQVNAIAGSVAEIVKKRTGERPYRSEGFENSEWILVDYVTVVVHIFQTEVRNFYNLESLWADAEVTEIAFD